MDIQAKPFYRFISAKNLMERWGIDFVELRQIPIPAFIQTKDMDYSRLNPYSKNCGKGPDLFGAITKVSPVTKEDFNHVMYDIYSVEQYEHLHPEIFPGVDAEEKQKPGRKCKPKQKIIPVRPQTQWHQIHFRIANPTRIEITTPDGMEPYHPDDLGFTPKIWEKFEQFAIAVEHTPGALDGHAGKIHRSDVPEYISADKADISRLRKLLRTVFPGVEGDPISNVKAKRYRAEFHITEA